MFISFLPESPRWLLSKGKKAEAYAVLVKYHAEGDEHSDFVKAEYNQIEQILEAELRISQTSRKESFSTLGMRKRLIIATFLGLFTQWSGNGLLSYYLSPVLDSIGIHDDRTKHIINLSKAFWSFVNVTVFSFIVPRYPRRRIFLACTISVFVVFTAWTVASAEYSFSQSKIAAQTVVALMFLYSLAYNPGFNALPYTFLVELFPFRVRARGITIYQWSDEAGRTNLTHLNACTNTMFENEQEAYRQAEVEILHESLEEESETCSSMEVGPRESIKRPDGVLVEF
ncbi:hexose transporter [Chiua virens]|nr:hexose transporter [Chiua virens]